MAEGQSQGGKDKKGSDVDEAIKAQQTALDDLVNANSIFTLAVFVGLSVVQPSDTIIQGDKKCKVDTNVFGKLIRNEVLSFAFFLLSSLVAKALKTHLYTYSLEGTEINRLCSRFIRGSLLSLSALGLILGSIFLSISMVELIEIRLGKASCRGNGTLKASGTLIALVVIALSIYFVSVMHAIYIFMKTMEDDDPK